MDRKFAVRAPRALMALLGSLTFAACESTTAVSVAGEFATSLSITASGTVPGEGGAGPLLLELGDTVTVTATATNPLGLPVATGPITWSSSDTNVVEVDGSGLVSATGVGSAQIRAVAGEAASFLLAVVGDTVTF